MKISALLEAINSVDKAIHFELKSIPKNVIYFLTNNKVVVYIGKSTKGGFAKRLQHHYNDKDKVFDDVYIMSIETSKEAYNLEQGLIVIFNPRYNKALPANKDFFLKTACEHFNLPKFEYEKLKEKLKVLDTQNNQSIEFTPRCSLIEKEQRLKAVAIWIFEGRKSVDIIEEIQANWMISESQAKRYIGDAAKLLRVKNKEELEENKRFYKEIKLGQYQALVEERKLLIGSNSSNREAKARALVQLDRRISVVVKSMAKIDGMKI